MTTRRTFLRRFGLGLTGSAALLWSPAKLLACCRGRRIGACPTPMGYFPPAPGGAFLVGPGANLVVGPVVGATPAAPGAVPRLVADGDVSVTYPPVPASGQTTEIPGEGDFCAWGEVGSNLISMRGLSIRDTNGNLLTCNITSISNCLNAGNNLVWGFAVDGLATTGKFNLIFTYFKSDGMGGGSLLTLTFGPYQFESTLQKRKK